MGRLLKLLKIILVILKRKCFRKGNCTMKRKLLKEIKINNPNFIGRIKYNNNKRKKNNRIIRIKIMILIRNNNNNFNWNKNINIIVTSSSHSNNNNCFMIM